MQILPLFNIIMVNSSYKLNYFEVWHKARSFTLATYPLPSLCQELDRKAVCSLPLVFPYLSDNILCLQDQKDL